MSYSQKVYDQLADSYINVSKERNQYILGVDNLIIPQIQNRKRLLDLGSGDGIRALRIKELAHISDITFVENSHKMANKCRELGVGKVAEENIEDFRSEQKFDVITCLWNVLGNVEMYEGRINVLKNIRSLLSTDGFFFFDVLNRYNISYYGIADVTKTVIKDIFIDGKTRNKIYTKLTANQEVTYNVHYFSDSEVKEMIKAADLSLIETYFIDYKTGEQRNHAWQGQLVYKVGLK